VAGNRGILLYDPAPGVPVPGCFLIPELEVNMAEPEAPRNLKRMSIGVLILVVVAWIIYAVSGGPKTPETETGSTPAAQAP
jgi:hypothetical protein